MKMRGKEKQRTINKRTVGYRAWLMTQRKKSRERNDTEIGRNIWIINHRE